MVSGFPYPDVTWYKPSGEPIRDNITYFPGVSEVFLTINDAKDYGKYKCRAENMIGYSERNLTVEPFGKT